MDVSQRSLLLQYAILSDSYNGSDNSLGIFSEAVQIVLTERRLAIIMSHGRIVIDGRKFGSDVVILLDRIDGNAPAITPAFLNPWINALQRIVLPASWG